MSEVENFNLVRLNNGDFYQFFENIVTIVLKEPLAATIIQTMALDQPILLNAYKKEKLTEETKQIVLLDELRDRAILKLKAQLEAYTFDDENPGFSAAAFKLLTFISQHGSGKLIYFDYNKETASITSLVSDVRMHATTELNLLNLKNTLDYADLKNTTFKDYYATRGDAASVLVGTPPFYKLRKEVTTHYRTMTNDLESLQRFVAPADSTKVKDLITRVNVEIDKFKLLVPKTPTPPATPAP